MKHHYLVKTGWPLCCRYLMNAVMPVFGIMLFLSCFISGTASAQTNITGTVIDKDKQTLIGVTVSVVGKNVNAVTDVDGKFVLKAPAGSAQLTFTYVGMQPQTVAINGRTNINITMQAAGQLQEVVVVGYGTQKRAVVSGAVATVKGAELAKSPTVNLSNSLGGRMAGVTAVQASGEPGYDGSAIRIRGANSLGNNNALVVIDGVPGRAGGLERLNPADVESVSVLKDASAAIYGSRAANGVILVTTRQGKSGKPKLSYDYNFGLQQPTRTPLMSNAVEYAQIRNELAIYDNLPVNEWSAAKQAFNSTGAFNRPNGSVFSASFTPDAIAKYGNGSDPLRFPNTDWFATTLKTWSPQQKHNLQVNGGSENIKYLASLGFLNQDGYYRNSATGYKQYDLRINLDAKVNKFINARLGLTGREESRNFPTVGAGDIFRMMMRGKPTEIEVWPDGRAGPDIEYGQNPYVITTSQTGYNRDTRDYIQTNGTVEVNIPGVEGLKVTGMAAIDKFFGRNKNWQTPWMLYTWDGQSMEADGTSPLLTGTVRSPFVDPRLTESSSGQLDINLTGMVNYDRKFGDHTMNLLAGIQREKVSADGFSAFRRYFISSDVPDFLAAGQAEQNITNMNGTTNQLFNRARLSYYGKANYNYKEKYLAEFLFRVDGSYIFPQNSRFGFFPGISAGWRISEESFFKDNVPFVNNLKLRGSWGQMGAEAYIFDPNNISNAATLAEYQYLSSAGYGSYVVGDQVALSLIESQLPNRSFTWEVANNTNIGLDAAFMDNKFNLEFDYFNNKRTNILIPRSGSIPGSSGITNKLPPVNLGRVNNAGFDFKLGFSNKAGEFNYNVSVNAGYARNRINFWDETPGAPAWQQSTGKPMNTFLVYDYDGVFPDQASIDANKMDYSAITSSLRPGDMKFKDINGDNIIDGDDKIRLDKSNTPTFTGGLNMNMSFKGFDCSILFQGAAGGLQYIGLTESGDIGNFLNWSYNNRWSIENPSSTDPRLANRANTYYTNPAIAGNNTYWARSNNYIRLKNLELGYSLSSTLTKKIGITNARIFVSGLNIFTIDKIKVWDPESTNSSGQYYPQARIINSGIQVAF